MKILKRIPQKKRSYEKISPVKTKDIDRSVRPKIKRGNSQRNVSIIVNEDITPSPIFPSKFKNHSEKCLCIKCFPKETNDEFNPSHSTICGCHDCFVKECHIIKPLSKEKLINAIRNFITSKELSDSTELDSHQKNCMCKNHLIFYKKIKLLF